ncbi:MAG TPA: hypothetical protein VN201_03155 [Roseateles sp.]|nr:hypothetical protein [Roseateles sp.]
MGQADAEDTCAVDAPPADAGENAVHAALLKVYPRRASITPTYSGCQTLWLVTPSGPQRQFRLRIRLGKVVQLESSSGETCQYAADALIAGSKTACPPEKPDLLRSLPPNCLSKAGEISTPRCAMAE